MRACVIFNPAARGQSSARLLGKLDGLEGQCVLKPTNAPGAGRKLAAEALEEGFDTVIAAGGDGTVNEVLNGLGDIENGFAKVRLGILPLGTINVFAKEIGLPKRIQDCWHTIQRGRETAIDLPYADYRQGGIRVRRYFAQLAGAGLDSKAIALVDWEHKKLLGPLAYVLAGIKALNSAPSEIEVSVGNDRVTGELVMIGNGRFYGGRFKFFPTANLDDGKLDVLIFPRTSWATLFQVGWAWLGNRIHRGGRSVSLQAKTLTMTSPQDTLFQLDGENVGPLPVTFSIRPKALRLLVPS